MGCNQKNKDIQGLKPQIWETWAPTRRIEVILLYLGI